MANLEEPPKPTDTAQKPSAIKELWARKSVREWTYTAGALGAIIGVLELPPVNTRVFPFLAGFVEQQRGEAPISFRNIQELSALLSDCENAPKSGTVVEALRMLRGHRFHLYGDLYKASQARDEVAAMLKKLEKNYGTLEKPRYQVAADYKYRPFPYRTEGPSGIEKNEKLTQTTLEILALRKTFGDCVALAESRKGTNIDNLTTNAIARVLSHPSVAAMDKALAEIAEKPTDKEGDKERKLASERKDPLSITKIDSLLSLTLFTSPEPGSLFLSSPTDVVRTLRSLAEISNLPTNYTETPKSFAAVRTALSEIAERVVPDLKAYPIPVVYYPSMAQLQAIHPHAGGFHSAYKHFIATGPQPLYQLVDVYAHELGHPGILGEAAERHDRLRWATNRYEKVKRSCELIERIEGLLEESLKKEAVSAALPKERIQLIGTLLELLQNETQELARSEKLRGKVADDGFDVYTQLDEAGAWLMQDILLTEFAHKNPKEGGTLLRYRDWQCSMYSDPDHWPGYRFAETLKAKMAGDSAAAFRYLSQNIGDAEKFLPELQPWIEAARKNRANSFRGLEYDVAAESALVRSRQTNAPSAELTTLSDEALQKKITETAEALSTKILAFLDANWKE